jgi:hypothetical protein
VHIWICAGGRNAVDGPKDKIAVELFISTGLNSFEIQKVSPMHCMGSTCTTTVFASIRPNLELRNMPKTGRLVNADICEKKIKFSRISFN